jgi:pimeloyl-ACP methyl ester carboxylesterase
MPTFVEIQGELLAVDLYEPQERIADAVLIHGFTGSKEDFEVVGPLLAEKGYRVLTFDNRGQHESAHSNRTDAYSMKSLARDAVELAQRHGFKNPHLFGHSFGGLIAQQAAVDAPDYWSSLTLFCSGPHWIPNKPDLDATVHIMERWKASDRRSTKEMAIHLKSVQPLITELIATKIPIHVIYGENDDAWPLAMQDQMAKDLSAPLTVIRNAGHCPNEDQPAETVKVLANFWSAL